jgi:hypothetical protein
MKTTKSKEYKKLFEDINPEHSCNIPVPKGVGVVTWKGVEYVLSNSDIDEIFDFIECKIKGEKNWRRKQ